MLHEQFDKQGRLLLKYGSFLPAVAFAAGYATLLMSPGYPKQFYFRHTRYEELHRDLCLIISLLGVVFRAVTIGYYPEKIAFRQVKGQVPGMVNTTGSYSIVRHPIPLGNFIIWLGFILLTGNLWFIIAGFLFYWVYNEKIMLGKEQYLKSKFGFKYIKWAEGVPAFIPNPLLFKKSKFTFHWLKILKSETGSIAGIFFVFFIFDMLCDRQDKIPSFDYWFLYVSGISAMGYIALNFQDICTCARKLFVRLM